VREPDDLERRTYENMRRRMTEGAQAETVICPTCKRSVLGAGDPDHQMGMHEQFGGPYHAYVDRCLVGRRPVIRPTIDGQDVTCEHGVAMDVHCCNCHSGFLFDAASCVCAPLWKG
jgi:hypothetical protein